MWIFTLSAWLHVTAFVLALGLLLSLETEKTSRLTKGLMRPLLTLLNVESCNLNSRCHQISFLGWRVEIIGEIRVWTGVKNCISFVDQGPLNNME